MEQLLRLVVLSEMYVAAEAKGLVVFFTNYTSDVGLLRLIAPGMFPSAYSAGDRTSMMVYE